MMTNETVSNIEFLIEIQLFSTNFLIVLTLKVKQMEENRSYTNRKRMIGKVFNFIIANSTW